MFISAEQDVWCSLWAIQTEECLSFDLGSQREQQFYKLPVNASKHVQVLNNEDRIITAHQADNEGWWWSRAENFQTIAKVLIQVEALVQVTPEWSIWHLQKDCLNAWHKDSALPSNFDLGYLWVVKQLGTTREHCVPINVVSLECKLDLTKLSDIWDKNKSYEAGMLLLYRLVARAQASTAQRPNEVVQNLSERLTNSNGHADMSEESLVFAPEEFRAEPGVPSVIERDSPLHPDDVFRCTGCTRDECAVRHVKCSHLPYSTLLYFTLFASPCIHFRSHNHVFYFSLLYPTMCYYSKLDIRLRISKPMLLTLVMPLSLFFDWNLYFDGSCNTHADYYLRILTNTYQPKIVDSCLYSVLFLFICSMHVRRCSGDILLPDTCERFWMQKCMM